MKNYQVYQHQKNIVMKTYENKTNENKNYDNSKITEKERFMSIIQTHHNYLVELMQQKSSRLLREHRSKIIQSVTSQLYASYLDRHLSYKEFRDCIDYLRNNLSWDNITGVKQLSIFEDYKLKEV